MKKAVEDGRKEREASPRQPLPFETGLRRGRRQDRGEEEGRQRLHADQGRPGAAGPGGAAAVPDRAGRADAAARKRKGSGRLELARWITDPANPLTARVMVNRIWQYHFGKGLVPTPSDFGKQGQPPTHPELLDWLAGRFVESGWSVKAMHRLIMLSRTYQHGQRGRRGQRRGSTSDNDYLWRFARQRLDAESIRDTILAVSGGLDRSPGGPHPFPEQKAWDFTQHKPFKAVYDTNRRSVYLMTQRIQRHPFLALFDGPDTNASTATRITSTTPLQALYLMNDPFVHEQATKFAARLLAERSDDGQRLELAYLLLFARLPEAEEQSAALAHLEQVRSKLDEKLSSEEQAVKAWESLVRALWMSNEFVYLN